MQVRYQPTTDRVLWQVRSTAGELFAVWLTRRMLKQLWPPLANLVTTAAVAQVAPSATVLPEAREMLAQAARSRPLPGTDFAKPFDPKPVAQPLGAEPLLPTEIDLGPGANGQGLRITAREQAGRQMSLQLSNDLATALLRLVEQALVEADWGFGAANPAAQAAEPPPPSALN